MFFWNRVNNSYHFLEFRSNDTVYTQRYRLQNGYILDSEAGLDHDVFVDLTHKEHLRREIINSDLGLGIAIPHDTLRKYILEQDPYIEFYINRTDVKRLYIRDSLEINEIIKNGEIDKYFKKLK